MKSPLFPDVKMLPIELEPGLNAYRCTRSNGLWIPSDSYWRWKSISSPTTPLPEHAIPPQPADDRGRHALLCPESGCVLVRFKAGHDLGFFIERSPLTGGIWLDPGEWEALKSADLHRELNHVFASAYQLGLNRQETHQKLERLFTERLGWEDLRRLEEFRGFLKDHPQRRQILAYLLNQ